jgi:hypothetical protein
MVAERLIRWCSVTTGRTVECKFEPFWAHPADIVAEPKLEK